MCRNNTVRNAVRNAVNCTWRISACTLDEQMQGNIKLISLALLTTILLCLAFTHKITAYMWVTVLFLPVVVFADTLARDYNGAQQWLYRIFGLAYASLLCSHIVTLGEATLAKQTPLEATDARDYITFVATFAWALLLLTYR